jgi:hypothetical protein
LLLETKNLFFIHNASKSIIGATRPQAICRRNKEAKSCVISK